MYNDSNRWTSFVCSAILRFHLLSVLFISFPRYVARHSKICSPTKFLIIHQTVIVINSKFPVFTYLLIRDNTRMGV